MRDGGVECFKRPPKEKTLVFTAKKSDKNNCGKQEILEHSSIDFSQRKM